MKLSRLNSVANQAIRSSISSVNGYFQDPFYHYTPEYDIEVDLLTGTFTPDLEGDDVEKYYREIYLWFHYVLPKEGIQIDVIDKAIIKITPNGKQCFIEAKGRKFKSYKVLYRK